MSTRDIAGHNLAHMMTCYIRNNNLKNAPEYMDMKEHYGVEFIRCMKHLRISYDEFICRCKFIYKK